MASRIPLLVLLLLAASALLPASPARADATTFTATADTYSREDAPTSNFGTSVRFSAQGGAGFARRGFVRFGVSLPAGSRVTRATLRLYALSAGTAEGFDVRSAAGGWSETGVTWQNSPAVGSSVLSHAAGYPINAYVELDVTDAVSGSEPVDLALTTASSAWTGFSAREDANPPQLVVSYDPPAAPSVPGKLHSTPTQAFVDDDGHEVRLKGFNLQPIRGPMTAAQYQGIRDKGFNAVRFVLHWSDLEPQRGAFDAVDLATLDTQVARAKAAGLYVVLDEIHLWGSNGLNDVPAWARTGDSVTTVTTNAGGYLKMLAERYRDEPALAAYDPVNEFFRSPLDQNAVLRAYDALIRQIRGVDPDTIVVIEPTYGDTSVSGSLADFSNLTVKTNVVWSIHDYFGGGADDDGYDANGNQTGTYVFDGTTGYASPNPRQLERHLQVHLTKARLAGLPVWIGEFGIGASALNRDEWIREQVALFNRYGLGFAWWEYFTTQPFSATAADGTWRPHIDLLLAASPEPPGSTAGPTISGTPRAGQTLTASRGQWSGEPVSYEYQWRRCNSSGTGCVDVAGATAATYALGAADVGSTLRVAVAAGNAGGYGDAQSDPTNVVTAASPGPTATVMSFTASADAYVAQASPKTNYGKSKTLVTDSSPRTQSYYRFDVTGVTGSIVSAKLHTWITDGSSNGPASYLTGPFGETTLTWANRPATQGTATDDKGKLSANAYADYDVTRLITGNGTYYITTVATSSDGTDVASRETSKPPALVLTVR